MTITGADGQPALFTTSTCDEIGALGTRSRVILHGTDPETNSRNGTLATSPNSQPPSAIGACRLSFKIPAIPTSQSYGVTIAGKTAGTWTRVALQHRRWSLYFNAHGDSDPATWRIAEVPQLHPGDIPIPESPLPTGVQFDPIQWGTPDHGFEVPRPHHASRGQVSVRMSDRDSR